MAIRPVGSGPPPASQVSTGQDRAPRRQAPQQPQQPEHTPAVDYIQKAVTRTYTQIRIDDQSNKVFVKVINADNDEVIIEAPPQGLAGLLDMLRQAAMPGE